MDYKEYRKMKKILILGASVNQLPLIKTAKDLGYYVLVCDNTTTNPGLKLVDKHYQVNFMEKELVLKIAADEKIDGVISNSEPAMPVVAYVSESLQLNGNTVESTALFMEKQSFRDFQKKVGLYSPQHATIDCIEELELAVKNMQFPLIIKPCQSSGSRGTTKVDSYDESINDIFNECKNFSRNGKVTVEEYVKMPENNTIIEGEIFVYKNQIFWDGLFYDKRSKYAPLVPMSDCGPIHKQLEIEKIKKTLTKIINESGFTFGQINPEMYFTESGEVFVIEVNPRQGGGDNSGFIKEFSGLDLHKLLVTLTVGDESYYNELCNAERTYKNIVSHLIFCRKDGIYNGMYIADEIKPYIIKMNEFKKVGESVEMCANATSCIGQVFLEFEDPQKQQFFYNNIETFIHPLL